MRARDRVRDGVSLLGLGFLVLWYIRQFTVHRPMVSFTIWGDPGMQGRRAMTSALREPGSLGVEPAAGSNPWSWGQRASALKLKDIQFFDALRRRNLAYCHRPSQVQAR